MDVFASALIYLAIHIRHESKRLGVIGKSSMHELLFISMEYRDTVYLIKDEDFAAIDARLRDSVEEFNSTLRIFNFRENCHAVHGFVEILVTQLLNTWDVHKP